VRSPMNFYRTALYTSALHPSSTLLSGGGVISRLHLRAVGAPRRSSSSRRPPPRASSAPSNSVPGWADQSRRSVPTLQPPPRYVNGMSEMTPIQLQRQIMPATERERECEGVPSTSTAAGPTKRHPQPLQWRPAFSAACSSSGNRDTEAPVM
jgi:hypothetical protein